MSVWRHNVILPPTDDGTDPLATKAEDSINYGTHTLPKKFWQGVGSVLRDPGFLARRTVKHARHLRNQADKAEVNRDGPSRPKGK